MERGENGPKKPKYKWKYTGTNPTTGKRYFEKVKVPVVDINNPPEAPPDNNLLTKEEYEKLKANRKHQKIIDSGQPELPNIDSEKQDEYKDPEDKPDWTPGSKWRGNYTADLDAPED